jgi:hypothetical protein
MKFSFDTFCKKGSAKPPKKIPKKQAPKKKLAVSTQASTANYFYQQMDSKKDMESTDILNYDWKAL